MHKIKTLYMTPKSKQLNGGFLNNQFFIKAIIQKFDKNDILTHLNDKKGRL